MLPNSRTLRKYLPEEPCGHAAGEISPFQQPRDTVAAGDDLLAESMVSPRRTVERTGGSPVKKHPTV
ncbi:MAG TPA: hypothetical protein VFV92_14325, partial [Candidatus Bathyarchaeia archaeon]|nr:hypothetical protein [Candidatus Bathyarchaeia archaeon]